MEQASREDERSLVRHTRSVECGAAVDIRYGPSIDEHGCGQQSAVGKGAFIQLRVGLEAPDGTIRGNAPACHSQVVTQISSDVKDHLAWSQNPRIQSASHRLMHSENDQLLDN